MGKAGTDPAFPHLRSYEFEFLSVREGFLTLFVVAADDIPDLLSGIEKVADRTVVVERIDKVSEILAHTAADVPGAVLEFRFLVDQVRGDDLVDDADLFAQVLVVSELVSVVEFLDAVSHGDEVLREYF